MRRVVLILAVFSGLLCAGFILACACTKTMRTTIHRSGEPWRDHYYYSLALTPAHVRVGVGRCDYHNNDPNPSTIISLGISVMRLPLGPVVWHFVHVPYWLAISTTAILPAIYMGGLRRALLARHRAKLGLCSACGYDLRESKERCPECGMAVPART